MKLMVIDGNSIINRAYYGIRPLTTRDGLYTHAVLGFLTTLLRLEGEEAPDGEDAVLYGVELFRRRHAVVVLRQGVAGAVVEQVPQQEQLVRLLLVKAVQQLPGVIGGPVEVRGNH